MQLCCIPLRNLRDLRENRPFTHTKTMSMNIKNNNNGRSRVSRGNKIQKLRKFRANEYRVKFTWTMLSAAEILYQKKRPIIAHIILLIFRKPHLKMPGKNYKKFAWVDWKNYYLHRRKLQKSFLYSWLKQLSCNFFRTPLGVFFVIFSSKTCDKISLVSAFYFREKRENGRYCSYSFIYQPVFCLRKSARSAWEHAVWTCKKWCDE